MTESATSARTRRIWARWPALNVAVAAAALAAIVTYPLVFHLGDEIYGYPGDSTGTIAIFWWFDYALHHSQSIFYNGLIGGHLGSGWELMFFGVIEVAVFAPLSYLFGATAAYNLGVLSSWPLTAWTTFLLARRLGVGNLAATFSALAFAFVPFHEEKAMGHLLETHMEVFPAFIYFCVRWRQGGSLWNAAGAGLVASAALWLDPYYGLMAVILGAVLFLVSVVFADTLMAQLRPRLIGHLRAAVVLIGAAAIGPVAAYIVAKRGLSGGGASIAAEAGLVRRSYEELTIYSSRLREFVLPWHFNPLVPASLERYEAANLHGSNFTEQTLFLGYTVIVLSVVGIIAFRAWAPRLVGLASATTGFLMSQPPLRHVLGVPIPGPSYFIYDILPYIRVYSRFAILLMLGTAVLAGLGLSAVQGRLPVGRRQLALAIPFLTLAVEFNALPPAHTFQLFPAPAEYRWLANQPQGILVEYPLAAGPPAQPDQYPRGAAVPHTIEIETYQYELYQQVHLHPLFNGAVPTTPGRDITKQLEPYYGPGVPAQLAALGITYVFVHVTDYKAAGFDVPTSVPGLMYRQTIDGTEIFTVGGP